MDVAVNSKRLPQRLPQRRSKRLMQRLSKLKRPVSMAEFELLPVEIMGMVLENLASPEDLASTIRASPRALAALQCQRRQILTSAICNDLSPEVLKEAISVLNIPTLQSGDNYQTVDDLNYRRPNGNYPGRSWAQKVDSFEEWYFNMSPADIDFPQEIPKIVALYRMRATVNSLLADLVAHVDALSIPRGPGPALDLQGQVHLTDLTSREVIRTQTAFFRYEILCRLSGMPYLQQFVASGLVGARSQSFCDVWKYFLVRFSALNMEELGHIHDYVRYKYNLAFKEIEEDAATLIEDIHTRRGHISGPRLPAHQMAKGIPPYLVRGGRLTYGSKGTGGRPLIDTYITNLTKLGLGTLKRFLDKGRMGRRQFITTTFELLNPATHRQIPFDYNVWFTSAGRFKSQRHSFPDATADFLDASARAWLQRSTLRIENNTGRIQDESIAWAARLRSSGDHASLDHGDPKLHHLRKFSWTFWDLKRLKQLRIVKDQSTESDIVFCPKVRVRRSYEESRHRRPHVDATDLTVPTELWNEEFMPQFGTEPGDCEDIREYSRRLKPVLDLAGDNWIR